MEQCAYISASRLRGEHFLTAGMDSVALARTTRVGDVLYVTAQVWLKGVAGGWRRVAETPGEAGTHAGWLDV